MKSIKLWKSKYDEATALAVVARCRAGERSSDVARSIGIGQPAVWAILHGVSWSHVTGIPKRPAKLARVGVA